MKKSRRFFASLLAVVLMAGTSQADITISSSNSPYTLSGTIADNIIFNSGTANSSAATTLNGSISGTGVINKSGARGDWLNLNGNNSAFSGTVNVSGNTWVSFLSTQSGSAKAVWNLSMTGEGVGVNGSGLLLQGNPLAGQSVELGDLTGNGLVRPGEMLGTVTLKVGALGNNSTFSGIIRDNTTDDSHKRLVSVNKVGSGTWTLTGANTFAGALTVSEGVLQLGDYNPAKTGGTSGSVSSAIALNGGTLAVARNSDITLANAISFNNGTISVVNPEKALILNTGMTGSGSITKTGEGALIINGQNWFKADIIVDEGVFQIGNKNDGVWLDNGCSVTVNEGGSFGYYRNGTGVVGPNFTSMTVNGGTVFNSGTRPTTYANVITFNNGSLKLASTEAATLTLNDAKLNGDSVLNVDTGTANGTIAITNLSVSNAGVQGIVKTGSGTLQLGNTQAFGGTIDSTGGTILFTGQRAFEGGSQKKLGNITVTDGTLKIQTANPFGAGAVLPDLVTLTNSTMINANGAGVNTNFGNIAFSNSTFQSGATATTADGRSILAGKVTTLTGTNNYMTGQFFFRQDGYAIRENGVVQSGVFDVQGNSTLTWSNGTISIVGGTQPITKTGTGTMTMLGAVAEMENIYAALVVNEGTFQIGNYSNNTSQDSAGFLTSKCLSSVTVGAKGTLRVDISSQGAYEVGKTYVFDAGSTFDVVNPNIVFTFRNNTVSGAITKTGAGGIAMGTDSVSGLTSITVQEGFLKNWGANRLGNGSVKIILDGGTFMEASKDVVLTNPIEVASSGTITPESVDTSFTLSGVISGAEGTTISKIGAANVTVSNANNTFAGTWSVKEGSLVAGNVNAFKTATVQLDGGSLPLSTSAFFKEINVTDNGGSLYVTADVSPTAKLTGTGELVKTSNARAAFLRMDNINMADFEGTLTTKGSTWIHLSGKSSSKATFNLANTDDSGFLLNGNALNYQFGNLTGTGWVRSDGQTGVMNISVVGVKDADGTFSGAFRWYNNGNIRFNVTKTGDGTWTLASDNQVSGVNYDNYQTDITIDAGTLELARKTNQVSADTITVNENGTLLLSTPGQKILGSYTNNGGDVVVDLAAFESDLYNPGTPLLTTGGTVTGLEKDNFQFLFSDEITRQTSFSFNTGDIISGMDPEIPASSLADQLGKLYHNDSGIPMLDVGLLPDGSLLVSFNSAGVPEPSTWVLLVLGSLGLVCLKRRKLR